MAVNLSPVGGVAAQFFTNSGAPLTGGKIFTYAAGTTTPQAAYTTSQGNVAWTNPIVLDAAGRVPSGGEIWITDGLIYKFVLKDANDVLIATYDNIAGINGNLNALQITYDPPFTGSVATNVQAKLAQTVSLKDFGAVGNGVIDDTQALQDAINEMATRCPYAALYIPEGEYLFTELTIPACQAFEIYGAGNGSKLVQAGAGISYDRSGSTTARLGSFGCIRDLVIDGTNGTGDSLTVKAWNDFQIENILFRNIPVGYSSIYINGNTVSSTDCNELKITNCQIYGGTGASKSGIFIGAFVTDSRIENTVVFGNSTAEYGIYFDSTGSQGARFVRVSSCAVNNTSKRVMLLGGYAAYNTFDDTVFGFPGVGYDIVYIDGNGPYNSFVNCSFEAPRAGYSALLISGASYTSLTGCKFAGAARSAVREINSSNNTRVVSAQLDNISSYTTAPFEFLSTASYALCVPDYDVNFNPDKDGLGLGGPRTQGRFEIIGGALATGSSGLVFSNGITGLFSSGTNVSVIQGYQDTSAIELSAGTTSNFRSGIAITGGSAASNPSLVRIFEASVNRLNVALNVTPGADNTQNLGSVALRWKEIYAVAPAINTSDAREKEQDRVLSEAEKAVALKIKSLIKAFKFKDAVQIKGDAARIHFGVYAQELAQAFESEGLDPHNYAMFCYDEWDAIPEAVDENGNVIQKAISAGNRYGVRYEELLAFVLSAI